MKKVLIFLMLANLITGCSTSGTSVLIGQGVALPPTDPGSISLLLEPPQKKHTVIALVEGVAATDDYFTKAKTEAAAITAMKEEAARIGANAIVLTGKGTQPYGQLTVGNSTGSAFGSATATSFSANAYATTVSSSMGWEKITFSGTAIRYTDE
ncbi:hypothetical protein [Pseudomonas fluorescens]|uniref:Lipoprotein n=1 Tax=Pseudomonas fluorescens TaxID=294 RepID=A0A5E7LAY6_PSEFL|nr:hypothetical protein [Pseudomonas fluorescens]VVP08648.1 hypothetical protein PS880_03199 [Pseudomonas fluorescens]